MARGRVRREQPACRHRARHLHAERGRLPDAGEERPEAAGPALFQPGDEVMSGNGRNTMSTIMAYRGWVAAITLASGLCMLAAAAQAFDESKYPEWKGKWQRPQGERPVW